MNQNIIIHQSTYVLRRIHGLGLPVVTVKMESAHFSENISIYLSNYMVSHPRIFTVNKVYIFILILHTYKKKYKKSHFLSIFTVTLTLGAD
jgi:hypothetical protein